MKRIILIMLTSILLLSILKPAKLFSFEINYEWKKIENINFEQKGTPYIQDVIKYGDKYAFLIYPNHIVVTNKSFNIIDTISYKNFDSSLSNYQINTISTDKNDNLLINFLYSKIMRLYNDYTFDEVSLLPGFKDKNILSFFKKANGDNYILSIAGITTFNGSSFDFDSLTFNKFGGNYDIFPIGAGIQMSLIKDNNLFYIGRDESIIEYGNKSILNRLYLTDIDSAITGIFPISIKNDTLFGIASNKHTFYYFEYKDEILKKENIYEKYSFFKPYKDSLGFNFLLCDKNNILWLGINNNQNDSSDFIAIYDGLEWQKLNLEKYTNSKKNFVINGKILDDKIFISLLDSNLNNIELIFDPDKVSVNENMINNFSIYPNPASDKLLLKEIPDGITSYEIYNQLGIKVSEGEISNEINVSALPTGIYFLKIGNEKPMKFVKK